MVNDRIKANAIALFKMGDTPEQIAESLELPTMLVKEWTEDLPANDLVQLSANVNAIDRVINGQVLSNSADNVEMLKLKIEEAALKIAEQVPAEILWCDPLRTRALNSLADTCSKLYNSIVTKTNPNGNDPTQPVINMLSYVKRD